MNKQYLEKIFSVERVYKYFDAYPQNETKAILHYQCNIEISEAFYPCLSTCEVALRNAINRELTNKFKTREWYFHFPTTFGLSKLMNDIVKAQNQIAGRKETVTPPKVIAELTLGFWVTLFNIEFEMVLWKDLRKAFPFMPKNIRQRKNVSAPLNNIRKFRNRIFHNEPVCWNFTNLKNTHDEILTIMQWINSDIPNWIKPFDRFDLVLQNIMNKLK
jgi:hypothetical protein